MPAQTLALKLLPRALLLLALALMVGGVMLAGAGLAAYRAGAFVEAWAVTGQEPDANSWAVAREAAAQAVAWYPAANGQYRDRLGQIHSWQQFQEPHGSEAARASRQQALQAYRAAVAARPAFPDAHARLAHTKLQLGEFDEEFHRAFFRAGQLGPWRAPVLQELVEVGLRAWPSLSEAERQITLEHVRRGFSWGVMERQRMAAILVSTGLQQTVCDRLPVEQPAAKALCQ